MIQGIFSNNGLFQVAIPCAVGCLLFAIGCGGDSQSNLAQVEPAASMAQTDAEPSEPNESSSLNSTANIVAQGDQVRSNQATQTQQPTAANKRLGQAAAQTNNVNLATVENGTAKKEKATELMQGAKPEETAKAKPKTPHKNQTTLLLASYPDIRARQLLHFVRDQLTPAQEDQALELLLRNDYLFQRLIKERENVLNVALDGDETAEKLRQIRVDTFELSNRLRKLVYTEILTPEQKQARNEIVKQAKLAKQLEAEKRKR